MYQDNDDLRRAMEALTIWDIWERAYRDGAILEPPPPARTDGVYRSPFRDDGKNGSFSVSMQGRAFKDFGGTADQKRRGVWSFHELCFRDMSKGDRAKQLIEWSGITPTPRAAGKVDSGGADPRIVAAAKRLDARARVAVQTAAIYDDLERALRQPDVKPTEPWPAEVAAAWADGRAAMSDADARKIAAARGWPPAWVVWLWENNMLSRPWERWASPTGQKAERQKAFIIQSPSFSRDAVTLSPVGYHQRFYIDGSKKWLYVPSLPKDKQTGRLGQPRSDIERGCIAAARRRFGDEMAEMVPTMVPPLPFVLGNVKNPTWIALLEGQWDAITFYGACGWFLDDDRVDPLPESGAVFGIRGVQGLEAFFGYWWPWLQRVKPRAWVIAQNDPAARIWRDPPPAEPGLPRPPSLAERLAAAGCRAPVISWLKPGAWGKDFNDYYRARGAGNLTPAAMMRWAQKVGIL